KGPAGWKVYDIMIESVSLVTNYRSQFSNEIRQNGLDSLNKKLTDKNAVVGLK
ncbi:MAG: ABC transporter substrate-binding protein, partial [Methylotenera sp.]|nr:ABC transporter substrate-binding protein [Methylotenera sp.]